MINVTMKIDLVLSGPVLSQATSPTQVGMDSYMARDNKGRYYLPYSLIKGKLKQSWKELIEATGGEFNPSIPELLGIESGNADEELEGDFSPVRGNLIISDFVHDYPQERNPDKIYGIHMDPERGAARKGHLRVLESPFKAGEEVTFTGFIRYIARDEDVDTIKNYIQIGLQWTTSFGAERTVSFGRNINVMIKDIVKTQVEVDESDADGSVLLNISIQPNDSFCLAKRRTVGNLFESSEIISGSVLRGALAVTLKRITGMDRNATIDEHTPEPWQLLGRYFNHIKYSHAFPAKIGSSTRPAVFPLSLVQANDGTKAVYDTALCGEAEILTGKSPAAPSFSIDWKESDNTENDMKKKFGWNSLGHELRTRTEIDSETRRAKNKQLFGYEMIIPDGYQWLGTADLTTIPDDDRQAVEAQLRSLFNFGLYELGKTKTSADVQVVTGISPVFPSSRVPLENKWVITMQTPALLCNPETLNETSGKSDLFKAYDSALDNISGGSLKLIYYFADQSLAGGYLFKRYQPENAYNPYLLTEPGSVFVLEKAETATEQDVNTCLEQWGGYLPLPKWTGEYSDWKTCPYLPEDGFGEFTVNLPCHLEMKPPAEVLYDIQKQD